MATTTLAPGLTFLWAPILLISISSAACASSILGTYPAIFVFGDSLSDTGNGVLSGSSSALRTTQFPYGETFPGFPAWRYSDGRVQVDLLASHLGLPFLNPYLNSSADFRGGVNYAVAGATALNVSLLHSLGVNTSSDLSLDVQISWHLDAQARAESSDGNIAAFTEGLYVIQIGGDDYTHSYCAKYSPSFVISTLMPLVIQKIRNAVETLLSSGAKNFLFISITPVGCSAAMLTNVDGNRDAYGCLEELNYASYLHGVRIQEEMASLRVLYPDVSFLYMDLFGAYDYIFKHKEMFGFSEDLKACCGAGDEYPYNYNSDDVCNVESVSVCSSPSEYILWDGVHFTDSFNLQIFNQTFITGSFIDTSHAFQ
ncbi:hypothetical protein GOP47_0010223 [Adiantum capillus-veneris]|uniref:GDSL esterase/lipase n=1 Tax=Adiantum capillus-veneris TaxID=13818 RepID=A0A9D4UVK3_ADICA|nr:hypothetical protein GOP47_0010223 [Adiantum capillus-veneris]